MQNVHWGVELSYLKSPNKNAFPFVLEIPQISSKFLLRLKPMLSVMCMYPYRETSIKRDK